MKPLVFLSCAAALLAAAIPAGADTLFGVSEGPVDVTASVIWSDPSGATLHTETRNVPGQAGGPPQSAEVLFVEPKLGINVSPHGLNIQSAFASSLATADGVRQDGGVGVSALKFSPAPVAGGFDQLVDQASWQQTFDNAGPNAVQGSLHLVIPELSVGLIGVGPQHSEVNHIETALAEVDLTAFIRHADGGIDPTRSFQFGHAHRRVPVRTRPGQLLQLRRRDLHRRRQERALVQWRRIRPALRARPDHEGRLHRPPAARRLVYLHLSAHGTRPHRGSRARLSRLRRRSVPGELRGRQPRADVQGGFSQSPSRASASRSWRVFSSSPPSCAAASSRAVDCCRGRLTRQSPGRRIGTVRIPVGVHCGARTSSAKRVSSLGSTPRPP